MKRKVLLGLVTAMSLFMLSGCGSGSGEDSSSAETADGRSEIEFWHCMGASNGELIQELTDAFNESQDEIYVKAVHQGSYTEASTKMQAALSAGESPVVAQIDIGILVVFSDS